MRILQDLQPGSTHALPTDSDRRPVAFASIPSTKQTSFTAPIPNCGPIVWRPYKATDSIATRFSVSDWQKIFPQFGGDADLMRFAAGNPSTVAVRILADQRDPRRTIGVVTLLLTDSRRRQLSFHGGAWANGVADRMFMYRGLFRLFDLMLRRGYRIASSSAGNPRAVRFMQSIGFRINSRNDGRTGYYITRKLLDNSKLKQQLLSRYK